MPICHQSLREELALVWKERPVTLAKGEHFADLGSLLPWEFWAHPKGSWSEFCSVTDTDATVLRFYF